MHMNLEKADETAKYADHAKPEWIGFDERLHSTRRMPLSTQLLFLRVFGVVRGLNYRFQAQFGRLWAR